MVAPQDVCKYYLLGLCPYQLFSNTKSDLGEHPRGEEDLDEMKDMYEVQTDVYVPESAIIQQS